MVCLCPLGRSAGLSRISELARERTMSQARLLFSRVVLFALPLAINSIANLLSIPILLHLSGTQGWNSTVIAQSVGGLASVVTAFGWGATGPTMVASAQPGSRWQLYLDSLISRGYLSVLTIPVMCIALIPACGLTWLTVFAAFSSVLPAYGASWFFTGIGRPARFLLVDTLPRTAATVLGLVVSTTVDNAAAMFAVQCIGAVVGAALGAMSIRQIESGLGPAKPNFGLRYNWSILRSQISGAVTTSTASVYVNAPPIIVSVFAPSVITEFNLAYKLFRYALIALVPVNQVMQGWVPASDKSEQSRRVRQGWRLIWLVALISAVIAAFVAPWLARLLAGHSTTLSLGSAISIGVAVAAVTASQYSGLTVLMLLGERRHVAISTILGALVSLPLLAVGARFLGAAGGTGALAFSEIVVLVYQCAAIMRINARTKVLEK